jgi:6-phosphogluconolactonase
MGAENNFAPELLNRMKLKPMGRAATVSILSLAMVLGVTSCSNDYTVAYLYMTTEKAQSTANPHGLINAYQVDYQSGSLLPLDDSPIDSGGRETVGLVVAPNNLFLYTVNNFDSDVVDFAIGTDGKLYPQFTYNITGSLPTGAAIDAAGKFLYVTFTYQNGPNNTELYTPANPGPGGVTIFPINSDNTLGTPFTVNVGRNPVGVAASSLKIPSGTSGCTASGGCTEVFVIEQDSATTANLIGFVENPSTGALTPLPGVTINAGNVPSTGFATGPTPIGILSNSAGTVLYITDETLDQVAAYSVSPSSGVPTLISGGTASTEGAPMGMAFDPSGKYLYVVAYSANTIDGYTLGSSGQPVRSTVAASGAAGTGPTCVTTIGAPSNANPNHAIYLYASNQLSSNITAEQLNPQNGALEEVRGTPFSGSSLPTCAVTVPAFPLR